MLTIVVAVACGILIGLCLGVLGGGGSILTVPVLVSLLSVGPQSATSASLIIVGVTAVMAAIAHARGGHVRWKAAAVFGVIGSDQLGTMRGPCTACHPQLERKIAVMIETLVEFFLNYEGRQRFSAWVHRVGAKASQYPGFVDIRQLTPLDEPDRCLFPLSFDTDQVRRRGRLVLTTNFAVGGLFDRPGAVTVIRPGRTTGAVRWT